MGLFDIFKKKTKTLSWEESIKALNSDKITLQEFINMNAKLPLYYSTPVGENEEGKPVLWLTSYPNLDIAFYPTFLSVEECYSFFNSAGRKSFLVFEGTLEAALNALDSTPLLQTAGLVIRDGKGQLPIPPNMRVQK